eukprot:CAMPEP_0114581588 /NCGR_PEP_ID=MMETSP0125-20121206/5678_1 /TAXON_ID=485358 ORGANISM="Aristerostoma sp., Strain ATCC 50986" /NCGR_SAMPLE_ID=MMETSP0125 /ASSEMBLY_ACC=CAM_ASM_000245 /LENGTH=51 /DNA_ID=CAMNT_0001773909 /DNA_START=1625 /DNA_END=1780 /DNA_ORIENTATION=+
MANMYFEFLGELQEFSSDLSKKRVENLFIQQQQKISSKGGILLFEESEDSD